MKEIFVLWGFNGVDGDDRKLLNQTVYAPSWQEIEKLLKKNNYTYGVVEKVLTFITEY